MKRRCAFSLVEVTLALAISALCMVTLLGLLPMGLNSNQLSREETVALRVATALAADLQAVPKGTPSQGGAWMVDQLQIPRPGDSASTQTIFYSEQTESYSPAQTPAARYRIEVSFTPPAGNNGVNQQSATFAQITVSWPAAEPSAKAGAGASVSTVVALNRN